MLNSLTFIYPENIYFANIYFGTFSGARHCARNKEQGNHTVLAFTKNSQLFSILSRESYRHLQLACK
jgi:hypothetical protein